MVVVFFFFFFVLFFFFQAEDGIRDIGVTGVQTCALPICMISHCHSEMTAKYWDQLKDAKHMEDVKEMDV